MQSVWDGERQYEPDRAFLHEKHGHAFGILGIVCALQQKNLAGTPLKTWGGVPIISTRWQ